jgi:imidazolonepropionase-like amidohydrolase
MSGDCPAVFKRLLEVYVMPLILENCTIFDGLSADLRECHLLIDNGRIQEISDHSIRSDVALKISMAGKFVMPGLIDAHFHAYGISMDVNKIDQTLPTVRALLARKMLGESLQRGFTTVRDAGGADIGLVIGTETGLIPGPRIFHCGKALSQTGGHGDLRATDHYDMCACGYCGSLSQLVDGPDEVRKAVREQFRQGATQIKIFVSGGVLSPADPIWMNQFTDEEIGVAVYEAGTRRSYVMAHAHTAEAVKRCLANGVRSIEHATILDAEAAAMIVSHDAFAVPTLAIADAALELGAGMGLPPVMLDKGKEVASHALASLELLRASGAKIGLGTDLLGVTTSRQSSEFRLRRDVLTPFEILKSATSVNAELLNKTGELGVIANGAFADLIAIDGNPLKDVTILENHDIIQLIIKGGEIVKNTLPS